MRSKFIVISSILALVAVISLVNILFASSLTPSMPSLAGLDPAYVPTQDELVSFPTVINEDSLLPSDPSPIYSETLENVSFSTHYELFNPSTTVSVTSVHLFYGENGEIVGSPAFLTGPEQYTLVNVADHTQAGYSGDVVISADSPFTVSLIPFPTANFSIENVNDLTVTYTNYSEGYDHILWEFGDGITSTVDAPVHTFESPGEYTTTITVTKLNCSVSIPECVSEYSDVFELIREMVYLPIIVTD